MSIKPKHGFTLIELLVVIAIIAILVGLVVAVAGPMLSRSKLTKDTVHHKTLSQANWSFSLDNKGKLFSPRTLETNLAVDNNYITDADTKSIDSRLWVRAYDEDDGSAVRLDSNNAELPLAIEDGSAYAYIGDIEAYKSPLDPALRLRSYSLSAYIGVEKSIDDLNDFNNSWWKQNFTPTLTVSQISHPGSTMLSITEDEVRNDAVNICGWMIHPRYNSAIPITWYDFPALWSPEGVAVSNVDGSTEVVPLSTKSIQDGWTYIQETHADKWVDTGGGSLHDYNLLRKKLLPGHIGSILD
jgi:prepilin-type N-terminal cleavage/methylation domain-containing protein